MTFKEVSKIDVSKFVEKKNNLSYLSWANAWRGFCIDVDPDAEYEIVKNENNLPYFEDETGAMVYTKVTARLDDRKITHEMWLPVMDYKNDTMKKHPYSYEVYDRYKKKNVTKNVNAYSMFDINTTVMRCLVKNLAMFGYGIYIYAGEDLPREEHKEEVKQLPTASKATQEDKRHIWGEFSEICNKYEVDPKEFLSWCGTDMTKPNEVHNAVVKFLKIGQDFDNQLMTYKNAD